MPISSGDAPWITRQTPSNRTQQQLIVAYVIKIFDENTSDLPQIS